jgi:hypothetical protein
MTKRLLPTMLAENNAILRRGCLSVRGPKNSSGIHRRLLGCHLRERHKGG